jgi:hypothetical protein
MPAVLAALAGCLLLVVAAVYFAEPAHSLPAFFPGHVSAGDAEANHHHVKHGIAALAVALAAFAYAWFQSGPSPLATKSPEPRDRPSATSRRRSSGCSRASPSPSRSPRSVMA